MAVGTVLSTGGLAGAADRCRLARAGGDPRRLPERGAGAGRRARPVRLAVELTIDRHGRVSSAAVKLPPAAQAWSFAEKLSRCLERAIETRLRLPAPPGRRPTRARTELLVGFRTFRPPR